MAALDETVAALPHIRLCLASYCRLLIEPLRTCVARMMAKRKRCHPHEEDGKRNHLETKTIAPVTHPTLSLYYRNIFTLKDYLLSKLPITSKVRRRKIASILPDTVNVDQEDGETSTLRQERHCLSKVLNSTLVCTVDEQTPQFRPSRVKEFETFSQHVNPTAGSSIGGSTTSISDLVDFVIRLLFHKIHRHAHRPPHMLCHGFQRACNPRQINQDHCAVAGIPGVVSYYPNSNVSTVKGSSWTKVLALLGKEGDRILLDLFLDCGIFVEGDEGHNNYYQLSGKGCRGPLYLSLELTSSHRNTIDRLTILEYLSPSYTTIISKARALQYVDIKAKP